MSTYTVENNKFYKLVKGEKKEFKAIGATLYPGHARSKGYLERCITNGIRHGNHTLFRSVLMFEGFKGENPINSPNWSKVKGLLQLGKKYKVGIIVEVVGALLSWYEKQGKNAFLPEYDHIFEDVIKKACRLFKSFTSSSLFCFTVMNEFGPYQKNQQFFNFVYRRLQLNVALIKKYSDNSILIGSGGLLHLSDKSGGLPKPFVTCPWISHGKTKQAYWEGIYSHPDIDFNMIHIYSPTKKILENNSEWSNLQYYVEYSHARNKPFVVDEFGHKLTSEDPTKEGNAFLNAVEQQLEKIPCQSLPSFICQWNFSVNSSGFDWWPEYNKHKSFFKAFKQLRTTYFPSDDGVKPRPNTFQLIKKVQNIDIEEVVFSRTIPAKKLSKYFILKHQFEEPLPLDKHEGLCCSVSKIEKDAFNLSIRFHLVLLNTLTNERKNYMQVWGSLDQNKLIPCLKKNETFIDFTYGDIVLKGNRKMYVVKELGIELIAQPPTSLDLMFKLNDIRFASKK